VHQRRAMPGHNVKKSQAPRQAAYLHPLPFL
jgi:hypothetical protein